MGLLNFKRKSIGDRFKEEAIYSVGTFAGDLGRGLVAGFIGTAAMNVSQILEMKFTKRAENDTLFQALGKVLGIPVRNLLPAVKLILKEKLINIIHYAYGTVWGGVRGVIGSAGLKGILADAIHFSSVFTTELVMFPKLHLAPPIKKWGPQSISVSGVHYIIYAIVSGVVFDLLKSGRKN
ncbi:MAG: hypothetical protein J7604_12445 [Sporocytophaga sp.]|uniref:hypothetical protein n=1 Tax=Sporocytophaga sp. TaxID=2231183 RepID=UPI001B0562A8|nr:hypothetical protein [Sporocytophaga sp.]MBO9701014.1 hypothetical protein [Sporocytophaga sp.]